MPSSSRQPELRPTVLLIDDDAFHRRGVRLYLERQGFAILEAGDQETAWQLAQEQPLQAAIVDIALPPRPKAAASPEQSLGIQLALRLKQAQPALGLILFSAYETHGSEVLAMIQAGYRGIAYKLKGCGPAELLQALRETLAGRVLIDPEVQLHRRSAGDDIFNRLTAEERPWVEQVIARYAELTPREREAAYWLAAAHTNDGIAQRAAISLKSAENLVSRVYQKLGLDEIPRTAPNLRQAVILAKACLILDLRADQAS